MNQVEVPALQVGRYLELLKRRRWQLLPAALLGLFVGILVAWLIPRYYEASTIVRLHTSLQIAPDRNRPNKDPFLEEISKAKYTIRNFSLLQEAVFALGFEDVVAVRDDSLALRAKLSAIQSRISVKDLNRGQRSSAALLQIGYRDQDRDRAAALTNKLQELYIQSEQELVHRRALLKVTQLKNEKDLKYKAWTALLAEQSEFLQKNEFDPDQKKRTGGGSKTALMHELLQELRARIGKRKTEITVLEGEIARRENLLEEGVLSKTIVVKLSEHDPAVQKILLPYRDKLHIAKASIRLFTPLHTRHAWLEKEIETLETGIAALLATVRANKGEVKDNPLYLAAGEALRKDKERLEVKIAERAGDIEARDVLAKRLRERTALFSRNRELLKKLDNAEDQWTDAAKLYDVQHDYLLSLDDDSIYIVEVIEYATAPATPKYPNRLLVSILGALFGLVTSIGLILLLDFMQATWKSLDEVRQGLAIPVLGGISFLELPEEALVQRRRRLRYSVVALSFLLLLGGVVGVYLVNPITLPAWVQDVLEKLIG